MIVHGPNWHHARAEAVSPSEKIHVRRRFPEPVPVAARGDGVSARATGPQNMSRFGTGNIAVLPASAFAAQILGQALGGNRPAVHDVADAYAHAAQTKLPPFLGPRASA